MQIGQVTTQGGDQCEAGSKEKRTDVLAKWGKRLIKSYMQQQVSGVPAHAGESQLTPSSTSCLKPDWTKTFGPTAQHAHMTHRIMYRRGWFWGMAIKHENRVP